MPPPVVAAKITTVDGDVAVAKGDGSLSLYVADESGALVKVTSTSDRGGARTVHLFAYGGTTARATNSFVFGYAPVAAASVEAGPGQVAGAVAQGVYVAALNAKDVAPNAVSWSFRDRVGNTIESGTGIRDN